MTRNNLCFFSLGFIIICLSGNADPLCAQSGSALPERQIMMKPRLKKQRLFLVMKLLTRAVAAAHKQKASSLHVSYEVWEFSSEGVGLDPKNRKTNDRRPQMRCLLCDETGNAKIERRHGSNGRR